MRSEIERFVTDFERGRLSRRQLIGHLTGLAAVASTARAAAAGAAPPGATFRATAVNHVALRVADVQRSRAFYEKHLGLSLMSDGGERSCFLRCGQDFLALFRGPEAGLDHYCYTVEGYSADGAVEALEAAGLAPRRAGDRVYFDDPDGIEVQVSAPNRPEA